MIPRGLQPPPRSWQSKFVMERPWALDVLGRLVEEESGIKQIIHIIGHNCLVWPDVQDEVLFRGLIFVILIRQCEEETRNHSLACSDVGFSSSWSRPLHYRVPWPLAPRLQSLFLVRSFPTTIEFLLPLHSDYY